MRREPRDGGDRNSQRDRDRQESGRYRDERDGRGSRHHPESEQYGPVAYETQGPPQPEGYNARGSAGGSAVSGTSRKTQLLEEIQQRDIKIAELVEQLELMMEQTVQIKRRNERMQELLDGRDDLLGQQKADDAIYQAFSNLMAQIRNWSNAFCTNFDRPLDLLKAIPQKYDSFVLRVTPRLLTTEQLEAWLDVGKQCKKRRRRFVRGWVALNIAETMFRNLPGLAYPYESGEDHWIPEGDVRQGVRVLEKELLQSGQ